MKVIFAGYSKCGTKTMAEALRELDLKVYDFMENYEFLREEWMQVYNKGATIEDFRKMYEGVDAVTDMPCFYFWEELLEAFPEAKIVFCQRQSEDEWWKSMKCQIETGGSFLMRILPLLSYSNYKLRQFSIAMTRTVLGVNFDAPLGFLPAINEKQFRKAYRMHNTYVLSKAPKDKMLIFNFKDGWEPLCNFLELSIPNKPFPHKNKAGSITQEILQEHPLMLQMKREMIFSASLITCLTAYSIYKLATTENPLFYPKIIYSNLLSYFNK